MFVTIIDNEGLKACINTEQIQSVIMREDKTPVVFFVGNGSEGDWLLISVGSYNRLCEILPSMGKKSDSQRRRECLI